MIQYPLKFDVEADAASGIGTTWESKVAANPPIPTCIPPEFGGPGGAYSPEDLYALAVLNCLFAMFKVYAEKSQTNFEKIAGKASVTMDQDKANNQLLMTQIDFEIHVTGSSDVEKTRKLLDQAISDCPISNSIKSGKSFHVDIS